MLFAVFHLAAAILGTSAPAASEAAQAQLGPNLGRYQASVNFGCETSPAYPFVPTGASTCSFLPTSGSYRLAVPGPGVITSVRVKTGNPPSGRMRVTVARQLGSTTTGLACCFFAGESQTFTPRPNRTNRVTTRIPVTAVTDINARQTIVDFLALTVLGTPIHLPAQFGGFDSFEGSIGYYPHLGARSSDAGGGRVSGYGNELVPLFNVTWVSLCGGRKNAAAVRGQPRVKLRAGPCLGSVSPRPGGLSKRAAKLPLACNLVRPCRGKLTLLNARGKRTLGTKKFRVRSGKRAGVKVKLNKAGKRAARGKRALKVLAKAKVKGGPNARGKVKLRR